MNVARIVCLLLLGSVSWAYAEDRWYLGGDLCIALDSVTINQDRLRIGAGPMRDPDDYLRWLRGIGYIVATRPSTIPGMITYRAVVQQTGAVTDFKLFHSLELCHSHGNAHE
jgi:hypothetical protein